MTKFKGFAVLDLFKVLKVRHKLTKLDIEESGSYPCYSSDTRNYGIMGYTENPEFKVDKENPVYFIFGDHTRTMRIATKDFSVLDNVKVLIPPTDNVEALLYISAVWKKSIPNLGYARHWKLAKKARLVLPVISGTNNINFQYMEDRVKALEQDRVKALANYLTVTGLNNYHLTDEEQKILDYEPELKEFTIEHIFEIKKGKRLTKANQTPGNTLFIGSTATNHGETARIGQEPIFEGNKITVCYNGSVGETFYQEESFWASDDINVLTLKGRNLNSKIGEYLSAILRKAGQKYGYAYKWNVSRMKKSTIKLPVKPGTTDIDFDYMEKYIRAIQKLTIKDVVRYKDKFIEETKKLVD